jgi:trigger factor
VKDVSIPGFRKGKVPRQILEARYGKEILHKDALDILIPEAYSKAIEEAELEPVDQPDIEDYYIAQDEPAKFVAIIEVKPTVELGQYTGLDIDKKEVEVEEEEINNHLKQMQQQYTEIKSTDKEIVEDGDYVILDYEGKKDGETFSGGSQEEYGLEIGSEEFVPGFEEQIVGHQVGEQFGIEVPFPEDYQSEDLAGETVNFEIDIKEIKEKNVPELDDELVQKATDYNTLDEYKNMVKDNLENQKQQQLQSEYEQELFDKISEDIEIDVPESLINSELDSMFENFSRQYTSQGLDLDDIGIDKESWQERNYDTAATRARNNLILEAIIEKEGIEVSDEELNGKLEDILSQTNELADNEKANKESQDNTEDIKENIKDEKEEDQVKTKDNDNEIDEHNNDDIEDVDSINSDSKDDDTEIDENDNNDNVEDGDNIDADEDSNKEVVDSSDNAENKNSDKDKIDINDFKKRLEMSGQLDGFKYSLKVEKAMDFLEENN